MSQKSEKLSVHIRIFVNICAYSKRSMALELLFQLERTETQARGGVFRQHGPSQNMNKKTVNDASLAAPVTF
jgi:hypothetical protein